MRKQASFAGVSRDGGLCTRRKAGSWRKAAIGAGARCIETKEFLGGVFLSDARDLDEAKELAALSPMASMGSIEIRPVLEHTHSVTADGRPLV